MEGNDDRGLDFGRQKTMQTDCRHALKQDLAIARIALVTGRQAAFFVVLQQCFVQRCDNMSGRGEAPLAGFGHVGMLILQVHGQRRRIAFGRSQRGFVGENEAHARHAFQAFARGSDQGIERYFACVDWQCAE
ncbi:hypothetical protein D3C77_515830 [compost metagenome]